MFSFARFVLLCFATTVLALYAFSSSAQAQRSLECQKVWTGPSADNDIVDCVKDLDRIKAEWIYYIGPAVALLLFLSLMTWCTCLYCGCYCKCCCTCITHKPSMAKRHYKLRKSCLITLTLIPASLCIMVFFVVGAIFLQQSVSKGVDQMSSGPLAFFNNTKEEMTVLMTDHNTNPPTVTVNFDEFNDLFDTINDEVSSVKSFMTKTIIPTVAVGASLGALVFILVIIAMIVTRCYCCLWCGGLCGWIYYLLAVVYSIFAFILAILFYAVASVCGEIRLQYKRYPGIFQWYFVPKIEEEVDFKTLRKDIESQTVATSNDACANLLDICEESAGVDDGKPFVCPDGFTSGDQCSDFYDVSAVVDKAVMKPSLIPTACPAPAGSSDWTCTIHECSTSCTDESVKDLAVRIVSEMDFSSNATTALALVEPLIQTDYIVDIVLSVIESKANSPLAGYHHDNVYRCTNFRLISLMFAVSFFIGALILLISLCVLLSAYQAYKAKPKKEKAAPEDKKKKDLPPTLTAEDDDGGDIDSLNEPKDLYSRSEDSEGGMNERPRDHDGEQPGEPLQLGADSYGIPAEFYQDDAVDEEEMLNRARQTSNRRLPLNPLAR